MKELRILILEDVAADAEMAERELRKGGIDFVSKRVATKDAFLKSLEEFLPDLILSDHSLPQFNSLSALSIAKEKCSEVPFILVSGAIGEEFAVELLKKGATDYIVKDRLSRLVPAVHRALQEAKERIERRRAEEELRTSEAKLSNALRIAHLGHWEYDVAGDLFTFNDEFYAIFGTTAEEVGGYTMSSAQYAQRFVYPDDISVVSDEIQKAIEIDDPFFSCQLEHRIIYADGGTGYITVRFFVVKDAQGKTVKTYGANQDITERKKIEEALRATRDYLENLFNHANAPIIVWDDLLRITRFNHAFEHLTGYVADEVIGRELHILFPEESKDESLNKIARTSSGEFWESMDIPILRKDGDIRIALWNSANIYGQDGKTLLATIAQGQDITQRKKAEMELRSSEAELYDKYFAEATINTILSESLEAIPLEEFLTKALKMILAIPWISDEPRGSILLVEDEPDVLVMKAQDNLSESAQESCSRVPFGKYLCGRAALTQKIELGYHVHEDREVCHEEVLPHSHYAVPILFGGKTLGIIVIYLEEGHIRNQKEQEFLSAVADTLAGIIMRRRAENKLEYLAYYDELTGLPNRNLFIDRLTQGIARAEYGKKLVGVITVDVDRFKSINDTYGLNAGDAVLREVAKRLLSSVREGDTVARLGNDDFGVLLIDIADSADIIHVIDKIMKKVSRPVQFDGKEIILTLSSGISVYPDDGKDAPSLIKNADLAFTRAKQQGRKNYQFFTEDMDVKASEFVLMEKNLFSALQNDEFIIYYQPYWDINTKKMTGMEALVRWKNQELGLISPGKFIPVLEDTGMIIEVGEWILRTAIRQVKEWQNKGYPVVPVSVNLSLIQFRQKDLHKIVDSVIRENGFYPSLLTLEITESAFMQDMEFTYSVLKTFKDIGVSISIDDFGTGYSSLAYLKRFPIDNLKIDISFIREVVKDPDSASIVMAVINMAHTLNLKTIAEGIETEEQWKFLRLLRCDMGQGFYFSKPLPAEEVERFLKQQ